MIDNSKTNSSVNGAEIMSFGRWCNTRSNLELISCNAFAVRYQWSCTTSLPLCGDGSSTPCMESCL